jgi:hypothetical protein
VAAPCSALRGSLFAKAQRARKTHNIGEVSSTGAYYEDTIQTVAIPKNTTRHSCLLKDMPGQRSECNFTPISISKGLGPAMRLDPSFTLYCDVLPCF